MRGRDGSCIIVKGTLMRMAMAVTIIALIPASAASGQSEEWYWFGLAGNAWEESLAELDLSPEVSACSPATGQNLIIRRHIFYNNSFFDGNRSGIDADPIAGANNDDADAIDTSKQPLLVGAGACTFINWTGYDKGINGLIYDIPNPAHTATVDDFEFVNQGRMGTDTTVIVPNELLVQPGLGENGSDRVIITFADGTVKNCWLKVTIKESVRPAGRDVSYWGNAVGDGGGGNTWPNITVGATDELSARNYPHNTLNRAKVWDEYDYNKDSLVNATDQLIVRNNIKTTFTCVKYITR